MDFDGGKVGGNDLKHWFQIFANEISLKHQDNVLPGKKMQVKLLLYHLIHSPTTIKLENSLKLQSLSKRLQFES